MSRRKLSSLEDYVRSLKDGHGIGDGQNYKPWFKLDDFDTSGRATRHFGITVQRHHIVFSDIEKRFLIFAEFNPDIIDIREQFPLFPIDLVYRIAAEAGIAHPISKKPKTPSIRTTDFLLTFGPVQAPTYLAVAVKPASELSNPRTAELLEIERLWWESLGVSWKLVTDQNIDRQVARNLEWISDPLRGRKQNGLPCSASTFVRQAGQALAPGRYTWEGLLETLGKLSGYNTENASKLLRASIWEHLLEVDLSVPIQKDGILIITRGPDEQGKLDEAVSQ